MFARCPGLFIHICMITRGRELPSVPQARFSPTYQLCAPRR